MQKKSKLSGRAVVMVRKEDEAPKHHSQLGDMKLSCPCPVWSVEDNETLEMKFNIQLRCKAPTQEKHWEFA